MRSAGLAWKMGRTRLEAIPQDDRLGELTQAATGLLSTGLGMMSAEFDTEMAVLADRWRTQYAGGAGHKVTVLPSGWDYRPLPRRSCSYCSADVDGIKCGNCGAPATSGR
jgi:hypothetical protein